jgi:aerobic carbon-monoxide dehydrogenase large subunit
VYVGTTEMGQGPRTVMAQIAAEELGVSSEQVRVHGTDTRFTPYDRSTGASRSTTIAGLAVRRAADAVAERLRETAGELWDVDPELVGLVDGCAVFGSEEISFPDLIAKRFGFSGGEIVGGGEVRPSGGDTGSYAEGPHFWEVCVAGAEVEVDPETGIVEVVRYAFVNDFGTVINPLLVDGQAHGGIVQGIGQALREHTIYDKQGQLLTGSYMDYALPRAEDAPLFTHEFHPVPATTNVLGAKGCGEAGCAGGLPSVMNALVDALSEYGITHIDMPATPERVWRAIQQATRH